MSAHTQGPWFWVANANREGKPDMYSSDGQPALVNEKGELVCWFGNGEQYYPTDGTPPDEADARLIAAAPTMLSALYEACSAADYMDFDPDSRFGFAMQQVEAAIAKATGVQP